MINTHAFVNITTREVDRLLPTDEHEPPDGHEVVALAAQVRGWPPGRGSLRCTQDGVLYFADTRTLAEIKAAKNAEINAARLAANRGSFTFQGKAIACDELSRSDIDGANGIITLTGALPDGWPGGWKTVDNDYVAIPSVAIWTQFYAAMVAQGTANFTKAQTLKAQVAAATTAAEVEAIAW